MNYAESVEHTLRHVKALHPALLDWEAMTPDQRAVMHYHTPHDGLGHTHRGEVLDVEPVPHERRPPGMIVCRRPRR